MGNAHRNRREFSELLGSTNTLFRVAELAEITHKGGKHPPVVDIAFADGEMEWEGRPILALSTHFPPNPDDPLPTGLEIPL